jgi:hypothetical protein
MSDDELDPPTEEQPPSTANLPAQSTPQPAPSPGSPSAPFSWEPPRAERGRTARLLRSATTAWIVAGILALAVVGLSVALGLGTSSSPKTPIPFGAAGPGSRRTFVGPGSFGGGFTTSGVVGTVASIGSDSFTLTARSGQVVTVDEQSSTTYDSGGKSTSSSAVAKGDIVLVQGSRNGNTVTATRVNVLPAGPFERPGGPPNP